MTQSFIVLRGSVKVYLVITDPKMKRYRAEGLDLVCDEIVPRCLLILGKAEFARLLHVLVDVVTNAEISNMPVKLDFSCDQQFFARANELRLRSPEAE
jgi:hypothetical protein